MTSRIYIADLLLSRQYGSRKAAWLLGSQALGNRLETLARPLFSHLQDRREVEDDEVGDGAFGGSRILPAMEITITQTFADDGVTLGHREDGFEQKFSYAEVRDKGTIQCPLCGTWLASHQFLVESMDAGIAKASENPNRFEREAAIQGLTETRDLLLNG